VHYADYKFAVTFHFEEVDPEEGASASFYQANIFSKVYRKGNYGTFSAKRNTRKKLPAPPSLNF
jgi:hypothetical protein